MATPDRKVLVPIDGSQHALHALRHAMAVAGSIVIVNAQPRADAPALLMHMAQETIDQAQMEHGRAKLDDARKTLDAAGRPYQAHVVIGDPATEIARIAEAEGVEGIIMGTRGMSSIGNLLMGSTAVRVIHLANVPVTLVK